MLSGLGEAVEGLPLVRLIVLLPWVYPVISALHILGLGILLGAITAVDLRLLRLLGPSLDPALPVLVRMALCGFALAAGAGLLLASVRLGDYLGNPVFLVKMGLVFLAGLNALALRIAEGRFVPLPEAATRRSRLAAALSLVLWTSALFAGRWIAFS
ncbi:MAG: hypothetical protein GYB53_20630 [Rhodobacteraceae bacterium]|nr:hypothetical protein [Paracoccaceae bacterium]MBR9821005.1 hypothetical protein [Paracoccaceae bacterium]